jgi:hypothetical protein
LNQPEDGGPRDAERGGNFADRHFAAGLPFSLAVDGNRVVVAHGADTLRRPLLSVRRPALILIQDRGDSRVGFDARQQANDLHQIIVGHIPGSASANLAKLQLGMISALPMQNQPYGLAFRCSDDLFQSDAKKAFLVLRRTLWSVPQPGKIPRET